MRKSLLAIVATLLPSVLAASASAAVLTSSPSGADGYAGGTHAFLIDLSSTSPVTVQSISTLFINGSQVEFLIRNGTALNGAAGSSSAGWTSLGIVTGTGSGNMKSFDIPDFNVGSSITGLAMRQVESSSSLGFRFIPGPVTTPLHTATDGTLSALSGYMTFEPFTSAATFSQRNYSGSITYTAVVPEPATLGALAGGLMLVRRRRA